MLSVSNKDIIRAVAGNIYSMHPYHMPEGIDKIMAKLVEVLDNTPDGDGDITTTFKVFRFNDNNDFENWLSEILTDIPEYLDLNVSKELKDKGVKFGDPENSGFAITTRYSVQTKDRRYSDFVDLTALIRNICHDIITR